MSEFKLSMVRQVSNEDCGLPDLGLFPLCNKEDITYAAKAFEYCPITRANELAKRIVEKANELGIPLPMQNVSSKYLVRVKHLLPDPKSATVRYYPDFAQSVDIPDETYIAKYKEWLVLSKYMVKIAGADALFYLCIMLDAKDSFHNGNERAKDVFSAAFHVFNEYERPEISSKILSLLKIPFDATTVDRFLDSADGVDYVRTTKYLEHMKSLECQTISLTKPMMTKPMDSYISMVDENIVYDDMLNYEGRDYTLDLSPKNALVYSNLLNKYDGFDAVGTYGGMRFIKPSDGEICLAVEDKKNGNLSLLHLDNFGIAKYSTIVYPNNKEFVQKPLTEGVTIDEDGTVRIDIPKRMNLMDEYMSNHVRLKEAHKNNNIEEMKLLLAYDFALLDRIEHDLKNKKLSEEKRKEEIKAKQFLMNDFKTYLKEVNKKEPNFDFTRYYTNCEELKRYFVIDKKTITGVKTLLRNILL